MNENKISLLSLVFNFFINIKKMALEEKQNHINTGEI